MKILSGISEGQVLQRLGKRGASVRIQGCASCNGEPIHATISARGKPLKGWKSRSVGRVTRGAFSVELANIPAGGPYRLELQCGKEKARVAMFFVGDVWLLAGQSNMEGAGSLMGAAKPHPLIRAFSMRREWRAATEPLHILNESPDRCHNEGLQQSSEEGERYRTNATKGTGVGLYFAREMMARSGVPQALICTAHGGTSMEQWDPALAAQGGDSHYGSMLLSVRATGQPVAGVLWYQGESDTSPRQNAEYTERMQALVAATRRDFRQPALPWIIVQIGRVLGVRDSVTWNNIQDQQRLLPQKIKALETVVAIDLALDDNIHISAKSFPCLAARMARTADFLAYGNKKEGLAPRLRAVVAGGTSQASEAESGLGIDVLFDHVGKGLQCAGPLPCGFTLLDAQGQVWPQIFKTTLHGNAIRLFLGAKIPVGLQLSYGHGLDPACNITDSRGHALPVFGPVPCEITDCLPFVTAWKHTRVVKASKLLKEIACPDLNAFETAVKTSGADGFVEDHAAWIGQPGHAYFESRLEISEPTKLEFLMGYDGPFRLWLDGKPLFNALHGTNPCLPDEGSKTAALKAGSHRLTVAMDTNGGRAWGFFLRMRRVDLSAETLRSGVYAKPSYCL